MKTSQRKLKATVVVVVVGLGLLHNVRHGNTVLNPFQEFTVELKQTQLEKDTVESGESKLFVFTRSIIKAGIRQLISNL